ncbi:hypothetical protein DL89DRAFT_282944 [Linderina pennispora]|uniref:Fungal-type protein kinase domain-containing protein n=1 Tax=Linderina pennispora TaxID=61395 RepID=A0A1Y1WDM8_9FUNG|nr:uncharacterized protein DL89DRAFT_282944 [Linderina pennispora]ORX71552.1 hypothetical protein DL89DRAFT_282944 [Linderina pennispora]
MPTDEATTDEADAMIASITADLFAVAQNYSHEHRLVGDYLRSKHIDDPAELCTAIQRLFQRILDGIKSPTTSITARAPVQKSLVDSSRFSQVDVVLMTPHDFDHAGPRVYPSNVAPGSGDVFSTDVFAPVRIVCTSDEDGYRFGHLRKFVEFFVYWAMCDTSLLGYDTTMRYLAGVDCWEIECQQDVWPHDSESTSLAPGLPIAFYARAPMLHNMSRLYGRHTRCFQASTTVFGKYRFVIKDTWALAPESYEGDTYLHEAFALKQVTESRSIPDSSGRPKHLPQEPHVGSLKFKRYHQRIVTTPAAMPVEMLKSKKDFLSGAADALNIHQMMEEHCRLIHGSMLPSNMVFYRLPSGMMSGFPVDLALAVDMEPRRDKWPRVVDSTGSQCRLAGDRSKVHVPSQVPRGTLNCNSFRQQVL